MKLFSIIFLSLFSVAAWSQGKDTIHDKQQVVLNFHGEKKSLTNATKPLIVLDGVPYPGIPNPDDIKQISLLRGDQASALYGSQASLGVIFIVTKQSKGYYSRDNHNKTEDLYVDTNALYIIDGKVSATKLSGIDVQDILSVDILKYSAKDPSLNNGINSQVIITTKQGAVKAYQKKFSAFSKEYAEYLAVHNNDDSGFLYTIKRKPLLQIYIDYGTPQPEKTMEGIRELFDLGEQKISKVYFLESNIHTVNKIVLIELKEN
ncbi:MAG: hypothetical protein JSU01_01895 [Bacteroidetes bacterium]|nr:hypothetical protein [Bacteroidota bacterium]